MADSSDTRRPSAVATLPRRSLLALAGGALALAPFAARGATPERREAPAETPLMALCREALAVSAEIDACYEIEDRLPDEAGKAFETEVLNPLYDRHNVLELRIAGIPAWTLEELHLKSRVATWNDLDLAASGRVVEHSIIMDALAIGAAS